jgi:tetratricopeptide (TPR) repeat protein
VVEAYEAFALRLSREFGDRPAPETEALVARVRTRRLEPSLAAVAARPAAVDAAAPDVPVARAPRPHRARAGLLASLGALLLVWSLTFVLRRPVRAASATTGRAVAIMPFATHGEPSLAYLGDGLEALLEAKLDGAGGLRVTDPGSVRALLPVGAGAGADPAAVAEVARRLSATHFVTGDVTVMGQRVQVRAELHTLTNGRVTTVVTSGAPDSLFALADTLAVRLLADASGIGARELQAAGAAGTGSPEAFRSYIDGESAMAAGRYAEAAERFGHALAVDSGFAIAAYRGATALDWASRGNDEIGRMLDLAERGQARLSDRQRRLLSAARAYYRQDGDSAEQVLRGIVADDPDAIEGWFLLGETLFHLNPARGRSWREARMPFERVAAVDPDDPETLLHLARLAAADGERERLDSLVALARPRLGGTIRGWELEALRAWTSGDPARIGALRRALAAAPPGAAAEAARALAVYLEQVDAAASVEAIGLAGASAPRYAQYAAARGRWHDALAEARRAPCPSGELGLCAAIHLGIATLPGVPFRADEVQDLVADVERLPSAPGPAGTTSYAMVVRAVTLGRLAASRGDRAGWAESRARLESIARADPRLAGYVSWLDGAWLVWHEDDPRLADGMRAVLQDPVARRRIVGVDVAWPVRMDFALALARAGHEQEALALFRSFPDASGRDLMYLPYARLGEARILARRGDVDGARRLYGHVLHLWQQAEPGFQPTVEAVRADSARLGR